MIGIIDYGMGNLHSVQNAVQNLGYDSLISSNVEELSSCQKLILPGVGAFGDMMEALHRYDLVSFLNDWVCANKPILGICLGMQAFFETSEEKGHHKGLGFLKGHIGFMEDKSVCVPHIGWNALEKNQEHELFDRLNEPYVYYVHSYYAKDMDDSDLVAYSNYGSMKIPGIVIKGCVMGCQFHPEKSARSGLEILKYFLEDF